MSQNPVLLALEECRSQLSAAGQLFVAYSGGLDSTVLLHAAHKTCPDRLVALHANHGLQAEARRWQAHCEAFCEQLGVAFASTELSLEPAGSGMEAAARDARYRWFEDRIGRGGVLLMAHHQDDQAETLLLRLLRGAGPDGLAGMPQHRALGAGSLLRPLLSLPRRALKEYAEESGLSWVEDPSNGDMRFDRNYLRREVMPLLERRWPGYRSTLSRTAAQLRERNEHLPAPRLSTVQGCFGDPGFLVAALPEEPALAALALRDWLRERSLRPPSAAQLSEFLRQLREGRGARLQCPEWTIERYRDAVYLLPPPLDTAPEAGAITVGESLFWPGLGRLTLRREGAGNVPGLMVTTRQGGERLELSNGQHVELKTVFQELAVPAWWRPRVPLLIQKSGNHEVLLAVGDLRSSPRAESLGLRLLLKREEFP
ncbi:tRNA lysidine(34) synthetase TilS [Congregibacter litoralis]|uniref:tRNA(Ile)-lysidine synthase n=1 Tax=Congregibacter litoralis KT71 TaxID=314285 RepID=A4AAB5_9GAMM|nr:tRNA lysidine(34) synthetase TilS [Congregibacter litoralis]EAQ96992.2 tRNA-lysidine synthetase, N-terminal domain protein/tRNA(Ile)-lysidine synthetase [Congregibacter litoralis KT71]